MPEYDCITAPIEIEDTPLSASTGCREDSNIPEAARFIGSPYRRLAAVALLASATSTTVLGGIDPAGASTTTFPTEVVFRQTLSRHGKRISLAEACRMVDEMQDRIDAEYQQELDHDAQVKAVWEEGE